MDTHSLKQLCGGVASAITIFSYLVYIRGIYRNNEKPHIFSWALWGLMTFIIWYAQFRGGAGSSAWLTFLNASFCLVLVPISWKRGEKNITRSDWAFFIAGISSIPLWYITKEPLWSVIFLTAIDYIGVYPTFRKSFLNPWQENISFWGLNILKWIPGIYAIEIFAPVNWVYPIMMFLQNAMMFVMLSIRRKQRLPT